MGFLDMFRQKDADPEIQKLQDSADASKSDPNPHVALALAYVDQFRTPPHWSESYAKKAIKAFHKAIAITAKFTPVQEEGVRNHFIDTIHDVVRAYYDAFDTTQPDLQQLEPPIWLLEQIQPVAQSDATRSTEILESLKACWIGVLALRERKLEDDSSSEKDLQAYIAAVHHTMSYFDTNDPMRSAIDEDAASMQMMMGVRYLERSQQSAVLGRKDGMLLNANDSEHKKYARQAIQLLRNGRTRLEPYANSEENGERIAAVDQALAIAYSVLYNLTLAHSNYAQSIDILKEGVQVVQNNADLWNSLGSAYEHLADETIDDYNRTRLRGATGLVDGTVAQIEHKRAQSKVNDLQKRALECYQKAHQLAPSQY